MGLKISKLFKHTYVVSEGVQTDISIQKCDEVFDEYTFITPPRDVQHLCDPRSITRGIARTPIMCHLQEEICSPDPSKEIKKCYLETNMDEVLYIDDPEDPGSHIIDTCQLYGQPSKSTSVDYLTVESDIGMICPPSSYSSYQQNIRTSDIFKSCEIINYFDNPCLSLESVEKDYKINVEQFQTDPNDYREDLLESFEESTTVSKSINIDSSEAVHQVCQEILRELLTESTGGCESDKPNGLENEIFLDSNISDITETMKRLCLNNSGNSSSNSLELKNKTHISYDYHIYSPISSKCTLKTCKADYTEDKTCDVNIFKKDNRQPLKDINLNTQANNVFIVNKIRAPGSFENSPLKSMLPLLPSQIPPSTSKTKPHLPTWDSENTLII